VTEVGLYETLVEVRALEECIQEHAAYYHSGYGMEAVGVGVASALEPTDALVAHYRGVGAPLAKGMSSADLLRCFLLKATAPSHGRTWHPVDVQLGLYGHQGTSGSEFGRAAGLALVAKRRGNASLACAMFGDGSAQRGTLHEAFLMASAWELPVLWVCENNGFMISTRAESIFPGDIVELAAPYHVRAGSVDGNDVEAVRAATDELVHHVRETGRPAFLEARTYRVRSHTEVEPAPYQPADEIERWTERDPVRVARERLEVEGADPSALDATEARARRRVDDALEQVLAEPGHDPGEDVNAWLYATEQPT
jgi:pyruvate dehydrogenase E1 component alpha subunit